jgi:hypothetical protein
MTLKHEREINVGETHDHSAHLLSLQDNMDGIRSNNHLLHEENEILAKEKNAAISDARNVLRQNNRVSATFTPTEELNNPDMNARRKDKAVTMRERLNHILTHDEMFKNLKNNKKGNTVSNVIYDGNFFDSQSKNALFKKAREELHETHFDANFLVEEIYKYGAKMNFTGAEPLHRVDKQG